MNNKLQLLANDFYAQHFLDRVQRDKSYEIDVHFDTIDIRTMIQGLFGFDAYQKIDSRKLNQTKTLVHAIAYFGWIKNIRMLPPHQDELVDYLSKKYLLNSKEKQLDQAVIDDLLYEMGLKGIEKLREYADRGEVAQYIKKFTPNAVELFKVNYLLKEFHWHPRLKRILSLDEHSVVKIDDEAYDFQTAISNPLFHSLVRYFEGARQTKTKNNFRDALSLCLIQQKIARIGDTKRIPLFYASTTTMQNLRAQPKLFDLFEVQLEIDGNVVPINVLRDENFFVLDALYNLIPDNLVKTDSIITSDEVRFFETIIGFKQTFRDALYNDKVGDEIKRIESELNNILFKDQLFSEFWINKLKIDDLAEAVKELISPEFVHSPLVAQEMEAHKQFITSRLRRNTQKLELIEDIWITIDSFSDRKDLFDLRRSEINIFTDLGLVRFSVDEVCENLPEIANSIMRAPIEDRQDEFWTTRNLLTNEIVTGVFERKPELLLNGIAILWIYKEYDLIVRILNMLDGQYGQFYQLALFHAASIYPSNVQEKNVVSKILSKYQPDKDYQSYKIDIGIGYIYYHIWKYLSDFDGWIPEDYIDSHNTRHDYYIHHAVKVTKNAYDWLKRYKDDFPARAMNRNRKYYYALNNLLYFKVRIDETSLGNMKAWESLARELGNSKELHPQLWQSRFEHTLALYHYRLYKIAKENNRPLPSSILRAYKHINLAVKGLIDPKDDYWLLREDIVKIIEEDEVSPSDFKI